MRDDPQDIIENLKAQLGAETDADLARKLGVDKSTISSWKSRGNVPRRFRMILEGASPSFVATSPLHWGVHEKFAFEIALLRFTRAFASVAQQGDYKECLEAFSVSGTFWLLMLEAQRQLVDRQGAGRNSLDTARALVIYDLLSQGEEAVERDRDMLTRAGDELLSKV